MRSPYPQRAAPPPLFPLRPGIAFGLAFLLLLPLSSASGQSVPQVNTAILSDGSLGTTVTPNGVMHDITGGTRPGDGANLFHSFGQFSIGAGDTANFLNDSRLPTRNILSRVTGGDPSHIFGTIKTTNFMNADLYVLNPAGVVFGPTASLDVGGSFHATTADYLRFADGAIFEANPASNAVLSVSEVTAFGFTAGNPKAIQIDRSVLEVRSRQGVSIVGGEEPVFLNESPGIRMTGGKLSAPGGGISLVSVASAGEVGIANGLVTPEAQGGRIAIAQQSILNVTGVTGGTVIIKGGELQIDNSQIFANTGTGNAGGVSVNGHTVTITGSQFGSEARGDGNAGNVRVTGEVVNITSSTSSDDKPTIFSTATIGDGHAGDVSVTGAKTVMVMDSNFQSDSGTNLGVGAGDAGRVSVSGETVIVTKGTFRTTTMGDGDAGDVSVTGTKTVTVTDSNFFSDSGVKSSEGQLIVGKGKAGKVSVKGDTVTLRNGSFRTATNGDGDAGDVSVIGAETVNVTDAVFRSDSGTDLGVGAGNAGNVSVAGSNVSVTGADLLSNSFSASGGNAGTVSVEGKESVTLTGARLQSAAVPVREGAESNGKAGNVSVTGNDVVLTNARFTTFTKGTGDGGSINLQTTGERPLSLTGTTLNASVKDIPIGSKPTVGLANIELSGPRIDIVGGKIQTESSGTRQGGTVTLTTDHTLSLTQTEVSAESSGIGDAGNIHLDSGTALLMNDSTLNAKATQASGGDITLNAQQLIFLSGSELQASVQGGTETRGGNIRIDREFVVIQQSNLRANAEQGDGGNIFISGGAVLIDPASTISVKSRFGQSGLIRIESPLQNLNELLALLPDEIVQAAKVFEACTGGLSSSLVYRLREGGPAEPGFPLASPVEGLGINPDFTISRRNSTPPLQAWRLGMGNKAPQPEFSSPMDVGCKS